MLWSQAVANPAWEAVINVVPPVRRDQTRAFLNGGPTQLGTVIAGLIQLFGLRRLSPIQLYAIGSGTAGLLTFAMWKVGRAYSTALMDALRAGRPQVFPTVADDAPFTGRQVDASAVATVVAGASADDVRVRRAAVEILGDLPDREAAAVLRTTVRDPDATVRATALRSLARAGDAGAVPVAMEALVDPEPAVRLAAIRAVDALADVAPAGGPDPQPARRSGSFGSGGSGIEPSCVGPLQRKRSPRCERCWRPKIHVHASRRWGHSKDRDRVRRSTWASSACGTRTQVSGLPRRVPSPRPTPHEPSRSSWVLSMTTSATCGTRWRARSVGSARRPWSPPWPPSSIPHSRKVPSSPLHSCRQPRNRTSSVATRERRLRERWPTSTTSLAIDPDGDDARAPAPRLLDGARPAPGPQRLPAVALLGQGASIRFAIDNLTSRDTAQVANALEALDSFGEHTIVRPLLRLWEPADRRSVPRDVWLPRLLDDPDPWIHDCAALLRDATRKDAPMTDALATMSDVERVLFLRKVPLFAELAPQDLRTDRGGRR